MPSRRTVLGLVAGGLCGALAGCIEPGGALDMTPVESDDTLGEEATVSIDSRDSDRQQLLDRVVQEQGVESAGSSPDLETDRPVAHETGVYDVSAEAVDETVQSGYEVELRETDSADGTVAYEDLPEFDRDLLSGIQRRVEHHEGDDEPIRMGTHAFDVDDADLEASVLIPDPEHDALTIQDLTFSISVGSASRTLDVYRYEAERIAASVTEYGGSLREYEFVLDGLSEEEAEFVETVIEEGSEVVGTDHDAYEGVGERLLEEEPVYTGDGEGAWIARYDGVPYWTELDPVRYRQLREQLQDEDTV